MPLPQYCPDTPANHLEVRRSAKESDRFGLDIARVEVPPGASYVPEQIVTATEATGFDIVVVRYPALNADWFSRFSSQQYQPIHADTLMYFQKTLGIHELLNPILEVHHVDGPEEIRIVKCLAWDAFKDYRSHYYSNPLLDREAIAHGYVDWALSYCTADNPRRDVFLAATVTDCQVVGFAAVSYDPEPELALVAVSPDASGHGLYGSILEAVERKLANHDAVRCMISTQVHNLAVIRTVTKTGYRPILSLQTVHLVKSELLKR